MGSGQTPAFHNKPSHKGQAALVCFAPGSCTLKHARRLVPDSALASPSTMITSPSLSNAPNLVTLHSQFGWKVVLSSSYLVPLNMITAFGSNANLEYLTNYLPMWRYVCTTQATLPTESLARGKGPRNCTTLILSLHARAGWPQAFPINFSAPPNSSGVTFQGLPVKATFPDYRGLALNSRSYCAKTTLRCFLCFFTSIIRLYMITREH